MTTSTRRRKSSAKKIVIIKAPTRAERQKMGYRDNCDICHVKVGTIRTGKKIDIWSFTVNGKNGKIFNRCKRHLARTCR